MRVVHRPDVSPNYSRVMILSLTFECDLLRSAKVVFSEPSLRIFFVSSFPSLTRSLALYHSPSYRVLLERALVARRELDPGVRALPSFHSLGFGSHLSIFDRAFCKDPDTLQQATERLLALKPYIKDE